MVTRKFIRPFDLPDDTRIWRYLDLPKVIDLLETKKLFLTRTDRFDDVWDGLLPNAIVDFLRYALSPMGGVDAFRNIDTAFRKMNFVSCWHRNDVESAALWSLYAGKAGVAIQSTVGRLRHAVDDESLLISPVNYENFDTFEFDRSIGVGYYEAALFKRQSFLHEQEIRLVRTIEQWDLSKLPTYSTADVALDRLIERLYVSPESSEPVLSVVRALATRYNLQMDVTKSSLLDPKVY